MTVTRCVFVKEVASCGRLAIAASDPSGHVFPAGLASFRLEGEKFVGSACDSLVFETCGEESSDQVCERRDAVHEDPETWEGLWGSEDTTEDEREGEDQVSDVSSCFCGVHTRYDHVCERRGEEEEGEHEEEEEGAALRDGVGRDGVVVEAYGVVVGKEEEDGTEGVPGKFDDDVADHEDLPAVGL